MRGGHLNNKMGPHITVKNDVHPCGVLENTHTQEVFTSTLECFINTAYTQD